MVSVSNPSYFSESNHELRQSVLLGEASNSPLFLTHVLYSLDSTFFIGFVHLAILIFTNIGLIHINISLLIYQNILNSLFLHIFQLLSSTKTDVLYQNTPVLCIVCFRNVQNTNFFPKYLNKMDTLGEDRVV